MLTTVIFYTTSSKDFLSLLDVVRKNTAHMETSHQLLVVTKKAMRYIEDIYFFQVNTKYISSNVLKISESRVRSTREIADIFNT